MVTAKGAKRYKDENNIEQIVAYDPILTAYFGDVNSNGSYLIAEQFVRKIANTNQNGIITAPNKYEEIIEEINNLLNQMQNNWLYSNEELLVMSLKYLKLKRIPDFLIDNNTSAGYNIYNESTHELTINNSVELSNNEKYAILAMFTEDFSFYSFAAEVEFHADALIDPMYSMLAEIPKWYESALRADVAIGEEGRASSLIGQYRNEESTRVQNQIAAHPGY